MTPDSLEIALVESAPPEYSTTNKLTPGIHLEFESMLTWNHFRPRDSAPPTLIISSAAYNEVKDNSKMPAHSLSYLITYKSNTEIKLAPRRFFT
jgi:hypothetical protein